MSVVVELHQRAIGGGLIEKIIPAVVSQVMETTRVSAQHGEWRVVLACLKELEREKNDGFLLVHTNRSLSRNVHKELEGNFIVSSDAILPRAHANICEGVADHAAERPGRVVHADEIGALRRYRQC